MAKARKKKMVGHTGLRGIRGRGKRSLAATRPFDLPEDLMKKVKRRRRQK